MYLLTTLKRYNNKGLIKARSEWLRDDSGFFVTVSEKEICYNQNWVVGKQRN